MSILGGTDGTMVQYVIYILIGVSMILFALILAYSSISAANHKKMKRKKKWYPQWMKRLDDHLNGKDHIKPIEVKTGERTAFRDLIIYFYSGGNGEEMPVDLGERPPLVERKKRKLRMLYRQMGFIDDDLQCLRSGPWWNKTVAFGRLARMELNDGEDIALDLLTDGEKELALSAISYLSSIQSRYLQDQVTSIYQWNEASMHKEITVELMKANIDPVFVRDLKDDSEPAVRKAAAMLTGSRNSAESLKFLSKLAFDDDEDVRLETARALGRIGGKRSAWILEKMADDEDSDVRSAVAEALGKNTDLMDLHPLEKLAKDKDRNVRIMAFANLSHHGWEGKASILNLASSDPEMSKEFV